MVSSDESGAANIGISSGTEMPDWLQDIASSNRMSRGTNLHCPRSTSILVTSLKHPHPTKRISAAKNLGLVSLRGDQMALHALMNKGCSGEWGLDDEDGEVRAQAAESIGLIAAGSGCPTVCSSLLGSLEDEDWAVRESSVDALIKVAHDDDRLLSLMSSDRWWAKAVAADALGKIASRGSRAVVNLVRALHDSDWAVRQSACAALGLLSEPGDAHTVDALLGLLSDADWRVDRGCAAAVRALIARLEDCDVGARHALDTPSLGDTDVKRAAVRTLQRVARPGDSAAIAALRECYRREPTARPLLTEALAQLCAEPSV